MSNQVNTDLLELASEHIDFWAGEGIGRKLELDIHRNDLEELSADLKESARLMYELAHTLEPITDETKDEIFHES